GLVVRTPDPADRRVGRLAVTDSGRHLLAETRTRRDVFLAGRLQGLTPDERDLVAAALPILERLAREDLP
ncbi:MAG: MarR family transcriptional regulator, partial [Actinomycetota bacterium]|nr:MarR family transcriptional regulator [Actinomycetota bacterium]